ncbi:MAG: hypothetical protein AMJ81_06415 [Phycisphaerae bacterium SM23_33]|nr:MAG: hypothetical protein AMJ81_06415 [Phycisphaerae bacterium SM23_33]
MSVPAIILTYLAAAAGTLLLGLAAKWFDRKVTARVQYRKGPPWYQPVADVLKLLHKETLVPSTGRGAGFLIAPAIALGATALAAAMLWAPLFAHEGSFLGDLIVVIYLLVIPPLATILGASASGSPHAAVGASREMKLILAYELPFVLALLVGVIHSGWTLQLGKMAADQQGQAGATLYSISGVLAMIVAILAVQAKLGQVPFDLAEAECEIMSGVFVEYSGPPLALIYISRAMLLATLPLLLILVFWGGLKLTLTGVPAFLGKYLLLLTLVTLIRNTNPRLRIDQAVRFFWLGLTPLAVLAAVLALVGRYKGLSWL